MSYNQCYMTISPRDTIGQISVGQIDHSQDANDFATFLSSLVGAGEIAETTMTAYVTALRRWNTFLRTMPTDRVTDATVRAWLAWLDANGISRRSAAIWLSGLRRFFGWAVQQGRCEIDPTADIRMKRSNSKVHRKDALSHTDIRSLLSVEMSARDRAIVTLKVYCGLRDVEITRLDMSDFGVKVNPISDDERHVLYVHGKGRVDADEFVVIDHPSVASALESWLVERGRHAGPLFTSERRNKGGRLSLRSVKRAIVDAMMTAGVKRSRRITSHSLRHTAITEVARAGGIRSAQLFARHANIQTTAAYVHDDARIIDPAELLIDYESTPKVSSRSRVMTTNSAVVW
jgi:integrase/recombinase XerD